MNAHRVEDYEHPGQHPFCCASATDTWFAVALLAVFVLGMLVF